VPASAQLATEQTKHSTMQNTPT